MRWKVSKLTIPSWEGREEGRISEETRTEQGTRIGFPSAPLTAPSQFPVPSGLLPAVAPRSGASDATSEALAVEEEEGAATAAALEAAAAVEDATVDFVAVAAAEEAFAEAVEDVELPATADEEAELPVADEVAVPA